MACTHPLCRVNEQLLKLLPNLVEEQQRRLLRVWPELDLNGKQDLVREIQDPEYREVDIAALAKLASYFRCGVYDVVRYTRVEGNSGDRD